MKISIVVAAYNIEEYISRCLDSLINQTFKDIEIIVVNDGSTDRTLDIINNYSNKDSRIVVYNQINKGLIEARKSGFSISTGEYILFIDGDDWLEHNALEILTTLIKDNTDIVLFNFIESYNESYKNKLRKSYIYDKILSSNDLLKCLFLNDISPCIWSKFIKRQFIIENNIEFPSNISYAEDLAFVSSLFMYKPNYILCNEYLYNYYQRSSSITKSVTKKALEVDIALQFVRKNLSDKKLLENYYCEYQCLIFIHLFLYKILSINYLWYNKQIHKEVFLQYDKYNVDIINNIYIKKIISSRSTIDKLRIKLYSINYYVGYCFDIITYPIRKSKRFFTTLFKKEK